WADWIWFPKGHGWADLTDHDGKVFPKLPDLWASIPITVCFLLFRQIFERTVACPLASLLGVRDKKRVCAPPNPVLEAFFCNTSKHPTQTCVERLSKEAGCSVRQVQRWFRQRRNQGRPSKLKKFQEASWRFAFYLFAFFAGLAVLVDKPWFYDLKLMWEDFPKMPLLPSQYWYYMIELGFYFSLLVSVASDVKRKDFKEQIIHHVATIVLISFSWLVNYIRAGTLIMLLHDASDYLMESAKMFNYAGWRKTCNFIFTVFAAVFIVTRLVILPFWTSSKMSAVTKRRPSQTTKAKTCGKNPKMATCGTATPPLTTTTRKGTDWTLMGCVVPPTGRGHQPESQIGRRVQRATRRYPHAPGNPLLCGGTTPPKPHLSSLHLPHSSCTTLHFRPAILVLQAALLIPGVLKST
ncbi:unnamed protein product, partial [Tetraodon nigroviridis]